MSSPAAAGFQWSDLARRSPEVGDVLDQEGEVTVTRGSRTYRIAPIDHEIAAVLRDMCRLLSAVVGTEQADHVHSILNAAWPWTRALPVEDQLQLAVEVGPLAETCESLGTWRPLIDSLAAWRGTARAWADGLRPVGPLDVSGPPVVRP